MSAMLNDIRIVVKTVNGSEVYSVSRVLYKEDGGIWYAENPYSEYPTLEEAYAFLDQMYKATLKPLIELHEDGSYE